MRTGEEFSSGHLTAVVTRYTYPPKQLIAVRAVGDTIKDIKINLSRLFHLHHGGLLKNDAQVAEAWRRLEFELNQISRVPEGLSPEYVPLELDVGWNFSAKFGDFSTRLASAPHPWVKRPPFTFNKSTLWWKGGRDGFELEVYNKAKKMRQPGIDVVRVEARYRRNRLRAVLGDGFKFARPTWDLGADLLRRALYAMPNAAAYDGKLDVAAFLAVHDLHNFHPFGERSYDVWRRGVSAATAWRVRGEMKKFSASYGKFSWRDYVPETGWPPPVEIVPAEFRAAADKADAEESAE